MVGFLKGLFGGKPKAAPKKAAPAKTYNPPSKRAEILKEAMAVYQKQRTQARDTLEKTLRELMAKPPKPSDIEGMTRLLQLKKAILAMGEGLEGDSRRAKASAGLRGLLAEDKPRKR
jgi:hypothetical protein